ncbi:MAG: aldehyde dehydrogenase family protein [Pseudomonadota bacterium]|jgi:acyl-CoA reductase-like NAD-dependent aldehyde dehydrogenase|uniref:aldehyde dehydrogenase family protein n=1 Tax=Silanimonas sp. TaxID=1929290 RepID=UPI0022C7E596|nr:aldehyde dehydrogenase family protein [Silanimonas sp.]MCZ8116321.1 aldehyde dehydrogenase family protein [Silanimonas sp.]
MNDFDSNFSMTIDGQAADAPQTGEAYNPATRAVIARVPHATRAQLDQAVTAARRAFESWRSSSQADRAAALNAIADVLERNAEAFMRLLTKEQGKPRAGAEWEILGSVYWLREIAKQSLPDEIVEDSLDRRVITRFSPLGVVGGITPWNFPVLLAVWKIAPALAAGNTIIVKPSPFTPLCTLKLGELCRSVLPRGVFNVVTGGDELGQWMTAHEGIDKIAFTGHTETGKHVMRSAAGSLKRITLELGGNDPAIVLPDVDPQAIAPQLFWAAFQNNAQFCNATKRLYVHEDIYDEVLAALVAFTRTQKVGDGAEPDTALGPIQNAPQYQKVCEYFDDCRRNGYRFATGGELDPHAKGWFVPVTLVDNPPEHSRIVTEEPFGPILPVLKWRDEADVVRRANDTIYGLGASVWGQDLAAVERIGAQLEAGTVWLNEIHQYAPGQAFGGHKQSGIGCENSLHGLMEYTNWKTITLNRKAGFGRGRVGKAA